MTNFQDFQRAEDEKFEKLIRWLFADEPLVYEEREPLKDYLVARDERLLAWVREEIKSGVQKFRGNMLGVQDLHEVDDLLTIFLADLLHALSPQPIEPKE